METLSPPPIVVRAKVNSSAQIIRSKTRPQTNAVVRNAHRPNSPLKSLDTPLMAPTGPGKPAMSLQATKAIQPALRHLGAEFKGPRVRTTSIVSATSAISSPIPSPSDSTLTRNSRPPSISTASGRSSPVREQNANIKIKSKLSSIAAPRPLAAIFAGTNITNKDIPTLATNQPNTLVTSSHDSKGFTRNVVRSPSPLRISKRHRGYSGSQMDIGTFAAPSPPNHSPRSQGVDPLTIPLPAQSPPSSIVSFTSNSTTSMAQIPSSSETSSAIDVRSEYSFVASTSRAGDERNGGDGTSTRVETSSERNEVDEEAAAREERAEAKTNRKIADLEITNKSLLDINAKLETTKHRLNKEVHELRRKLREARLALPPARFRYLKSTDPEFAREFGDSEKSSEEEEEKGYGTVAEGEGEEEEEEEEEEGRGDVRYDRMSQLVLGMISTGQRALDAKMEEGKTGYNNHMERRVQVLHADELEEMAKG